MSNPGEAEAVKQAAGTRQVGQVNFWAIRQLGNQAPGNFGQAGRWARKTFGQCQQQQAVMQAGVQTGDPQPGRKY